VQESLYGADVMTVGGPDKAEQIRRCLTTGYFAHAARMQPDGSFLTVNGGTVLFAHPTSLMFVSTNLLHQKRNMLTCEQNRKADWVVFHEIMETGKKIYIRDITKIEKSWLLEYAPEFYNIKK